MSKDKSLDTTIVRDGVCSKKHNTPREILEKVKILKRLDFIEHIGLGRFRETKKFPRIEIIGFDNNKGSYNIQIIGKKYEQKGFVKINFNNRTPAVEDYHIIKMIRTFYER